MRYRTHHSARAFTLMEVIIVVGIFSIMFLALIKFFISYNTSYIFERAVVTTSSSADALMNEIEAAVLPANQVVASRTFGAVTYTSGASVLVLEVPSIDSSGVIISGTYDHIVFYTNGKYVYEIIDANAASSRKSRTRQLSDSLSALTFTYDNASFPSVKQVTADITTQAVFPTRTTQSHLRQQIYLRNVSSS